MIWLKIAATGAIMLTVANILFILVHAAADCEAGLEICKWYTLLSVVVVVVVGAGLLIQVWS